MQACVIEEYGPPEVVQVQSEPVPQIGPGQVLVRVHATSVNTGDWRIRASDFPFGFGLLGRLALGVFRPRIRILGMDFSGVVSRVGAGVKDFQVGDAVFGAASRGAHAEYLAVNESAAFLQKPLQLSHVEAAAVSFGANCALSFLRDVAKLQAGQRILIVGASGGVGVWGVQIARVLGAEVTAVCSAGNAALVRELGAQHVIDYQSESVLSKDRKYDVIFDTVGATSFAECRSSLTSTGQFIPLTATVREIWQSIWTRFRRGPRVRFAVSSNTRQSLRVVSQLITENKIRPVIDGTFPMARIVDAYRRVESRRKVGTVVVTLP